MHPLLEKSNELRIHMYIFNAGRQFPFFNTENVYKKGKINIMLKKKYNLIIISIQ